MTNDDGYSLSKSPMFIGTNYAFRKVILRTYILTLGSNVYNIVQNGHKNIYVLISKDEKLEFTINDKINKSNHELFILL